MTTRSMILYTHEQGNVPFFINRRTYEYSTQSHERQIADRFAEENDVRYGHIAIMEDGQCINKLQVGV